MNMRSVFVTQKHRNENRKEITPVQIPFIIIQKIPKPVLIILFGLLLGLPFLGSAELTAITEGEYAGIAREMVGRLDFLSPHFNQVYWVDKPPLYFWLIVVSGWLGNWSEWAVRLPGVFMSIFTALVIYVMGKRFFTRKTGITAALIFLTCVESIVGGQMIQTDMTLAFLITLALYFFIDFVDNPAHKRSVYGFFMASAGAVMTKGLIGLIIPGGGIFIYLLWSKKWRLIAANIRELIIGSLIFVGLAAPWYVRETMIHGREFFDKFFIFFNVMRYFRGIGNPNPWYYYFLTVPLTLFPWICLLRPVITGFTAMQNQDFRRVVAGVSVFTFIFFTLSQTRYYTYLLPVYPLWSLVIACGWESFWQKEERFVGKLFAGMLLVLLLLMVGVGIGSFMIPGRNLFLLVWPVIIILLVAVVGIICGVWLKNRSGSYYLGWVLMMMLALTITVKGTIVPYIQNNVLYIRDFAQIINQEYQPGNRIGITYKRATTLVYYTQRRVTFVPDIQKYLAQSERVFLVMPKQELQELKGKAVIMKEKAGWMLVSNR